VKLTTHLPSIAEALSFGIIYTFVGLVWRTLHNEKLHLRFSPNVAMIRPVIIYCSYLFGWGETEST
jgi:hypothetical protein